MYAFKKLITKLWKILSSEDRRRLQLICFLVAIMSVFELLGVVSVLPFMRVATDPEVIKENKFLFFLYNELQFSSEKRFLIVLGAFSFIALVLGNSFKTISNFMLLKFANYQDHKLSRKALEVYLSRPYEYFLNINSAEISKVSLDEVGEVVHKVLIPLLHSFSRICVAALIVVMLFFVDPLVALIMTLLVGGSYYSIYRLSKKKLKSYGEKRVDFNKKRYKLVSEAAGGIMEIKLKHKEKFYLDRFSPYSKEIAKVQTYSAIIGDAPKYVIETVAFGSILLVVIYLIGTQGHSKAISLTALYAFAGYKLMPALQSIFKAATKIRFGIPALYEFENFLKSYESKNVFSRSQVSPLAFKRAIYLYKLSFWYSGANTSALKNIDLRIEKNTTVGIIGQTGSGKSTLIGIILGLLKPTKGDIYIDDLLLNNNNLEQWQKNIGFVPQSIYLTDDTIEANIAFGVPQENINREQVVHAAKLAQIHDFIVEELPNEYRTTVGERGVRLSGGQRQRIGIARALYDDPDLLIFDEATSALDKDTEDILMRAIENLTGEKTMIIIAHRLSTLRKADKIFRLDKGSITEEHIDVRGIAQQ